MYYPYTAGVAALSHFYFNPLYFANDPSAGHAMFALDYRECGKDGEPKVVLVEQEWDFEIVELAPDSETFIRSLRHEDEFSDE